MYNKIKLEGANIYLTEKANLNRFVFRPIFKIVNIWWFPIAWVMQYKRHSLHMISGKTQIFSYFTTDSFTSCQQNLDLYVLTYSGSFWRIDVTWSYFEALPTISVALFWIHWSQFKLNLDIPYSKDLQ